MTDATNSPFLAVAEAARYLRLKKRTLDNMRWIGTGPAFRKHGGRVYYHFDELMQWSEERRLISTLDYWTTPMIVTMASQSSAGRIGRRGTQNISLNYHNDYANRCLLRLSRLSQSNESSLCGSLK
jgi:Helix-turn-helix domain